VSNIVPEPPDTESGTNEEWEAFGAEMKRTEPKFKAVMVASSIDVIKASPEYVALQAKVVELRALIHAKHEEHNAIFSTLGDLMANLKTE
jgi:hypothetical protein